jgi:hypothetical protein
MSKMFNEDRPVVPQKGSGKVSQIREFMFMLNSYVHKCK